MGWTKTALATAALVALMIGPRLLRTSSQVASQDAATLVILSPHHEAILYEFSQGFSEWHERRFGGPVRVDVRNVGNTGQISRYVASEFEAAFERFYQSRHAGQAIPLQQWARPSRHADAQRRAIAERLRAELLAPENARAIGIDVDLFFGGGPFEHERFRRAGYSVPCPVDRDILKGIPQQWAGTDYYYIDEQPGEQRRSPDFDPTADWRPGRDGYWYGAALTGFGIVYNRVALAHPHVRRPDPIQWRDLAHPRLYRWVGLADPRDSGSATVGFEMIVQSEMARAFQPAQHPVSDALEQGWRNGLNLIKRMGANARFFTESSTRVPLDVAARNAAAGMAIDFYGRFQSEYVGGDEVGYVNPTGGSIISPDPICLLRGAPNHEIAVRFVEYVLSIEGQMLWDLPTGFVDAASGRRGPLRTTNRRMAIRPDVYEMYGPYLKNQENPFESTAERLDYRSEYTGPLFGLLRVLIGAMCIDTHDELRRTWQSINESTKPGPQVPTVTSDRTTTQDPEIMRHFDWLPVTHAEALLLAGADDEQIRTLHPMWSPSRAHQQRRGAIDDRQRRTELALEWFREFRRRYALAEREAETATLRPK